MKWIDDNIEELIVIMGLFVFATFIAIVAISSKKVGIKDVHDKSKDLTLKRIEFVNSSELNEREKASRIEEILWFQKELLKENKK